MATYKLARSMVPGFHPQDAEYRDEGADNKGVTQHKMNTESSSEQDEQESEDESADE